MGIESSRLSLPTTAETRMDPVLAISSEEPPRTYLVAVPGDRSQFIPVNQAAMEEGQLAVYVNPTTRQASLRCVVNIEGTLVWAGASLGSPSSKYNSGPYDPKRGNIGLMNG